MATTKTTMQIEIIPPKFDVDKHLFELRQILHDRQPADIKRRRLRLFMQKLYELGLSEGQD